MVTKSEVYAARLNVDYPQRLDRMTTAFRLFWVIPIAIVLTLLSSQATSTATVVSSSGQFVSQVPRSGGGIAGGLFGATLLMILFRQRYPRWWFDFALHDRRAVLLVQLPPTLERDDERLGGFLDRLPGGSRLLARCAIPAGTRRRSSICWRGTVRRTV